MTSLLVTNIGELTTNGPQGTVQHASLIVDEGRVAWIGGESHQPPTDARLDVEGRAVIPGFVDSHAHLVFAGSRAVEFAARMAGEPYTGGGIRTTVAATRAAPDQTLRANLARAFDADQAREVLAAGVSTGLAPRIHANQLGEGDGVQLAVEMQAASADHCTHLSTKDVDALADSATVATLLPGAEFSTRSPYPDARALLDAGATVALATDCNPGSSYTTSMPFCIALAVREMRMTPAEALWAATAGGARALRRDDIGHLSVGARADLTVLDAPSFLHLAYRPGVPLVHTVLRNGEPICTP